LEGEESYVKLSISLKTIGLLICSNAFMNAAWYGHLKFRSAWLPLAILVSWLIALPEYALQVPANRIGAAQLSATQLKIIQEVISISVFVVFAFFYFRETPTWRTILAFALILGAVFLVQPSAVNRSVDHSPQSDSLPSEKQIESVL
jgi:uncharacterized protein (DUF486 family)